MISAAAVNPGKMDRRLVLRYPVLTRNEMGESIENWVEGTTVWASWLPANSREFIAAQARHSETTGVFRIRHRTDIEADWRLVKGDDLFKLTGDPIEVGRREYLDVPVAALDQSPGDALSVLILEGAGAAFLQLESELPFLLEPAA